MTLDSKVKKKIKSIISSKDKFEQNYMTILESANTNKMLD